MKKILVVLTILVLVAGFAFADLTIDGAFSGEYTFDFDKDNPSQYYNGAAGDGSSFKLTFAADTKDLTGESGVYAKAAVSFELSYDFAGYYKKGKFYNWSSKGADFAAALEKAISLDTVEIVGENWSLDLIHTLTGADYAKDGFDSEFYPVPGDKKNYFPTYGYSQALVSGKQTVPGVTFTYDGFKVSAAYNNKYVEETNMENPSNAGADAYVEDHYEKSFLIAAETKEFDFNGFKLQAFVGYSEGNSWLVYKWVDDGFDDVGDYVEGHWDVDDPKPVWALGKDVKDVPLKKVVVGSAKVGYETEDVKVNAAVDLGATSKENIDYDIAVNVAYAPVTFDFYYASKATLSYTSKKDVYTEVPLRSPILKFMSMQAVVALADVIENVPVTVTANAKNVLNAADLSVSVNTTAVENFDITVYFKDFLEKAYYRQTLGADVKFSGIEHVVLKAGASYSFGKKQFDISAGAEYTAEMFTASATAALRKVADVDADYAFVVKVSSDKLVQNAALSAEFVWDAKAIIKDSWNNGKSLTLACEIEF